MCGIPQVFRLIGNKVIDLVYLKLGGQNSYGPSSYLYIYGFHHLLVNVKGCPPHYYNLSLKGPLNHITVIYTIWIW